jgi:rare lipoprotein A
VTVLADRYTGRHIRQARHGAWVNKKRARSRPSRNLLPAAAALTVAGVLIGGAGAVVQLSAGGGSDADLAGGYDPANYPPPDRDAQANRATRGDARTTSAATAGTTETTPAEPPAGHGAVAATGTCEASFYAEPQDTASGESFDPDALTAAHKSLPFGSQVRVTNLSNGRSVVVRINDRGPYVDGRCIDLSRAAFGEISGLGAGVVDVRYEVLVEDAT